VIGLLVCYYRSSFVVIVDTSGEQLLYGRAKLTVLVCMKYNKYISLTTQTMCIVASIK